MALDRTYFNTLVDETSPGSGTPVDKAMIDAIYDDIDAALGGAWTVISNTATGAQNNWAPAGLSGNTLIKWNGASDAAFTGLAGGSAGQLVIVKNVTTTKIATFAHVSGSSSAANQFTNAATVGTTPIAPSGSIIYQHDGTNWQMVSHLQGDYVSVTYNSADFDGNGTGTWTVDSGDMVGYRYWLTGRKLTVSVVLTATTTSGLGIGLFIKIPNSFTIASATVVNQICAQQVTAGGGFGIVQVNGSVSTTKIRVLKPDFSSYANQTNAVDASFTIEFPVT